MKNNLELKPINLSETFRKKWNVGNTNDFCNLYKNGVIVSESLFRVGGIGSSKKDKKYKLLLIYRKEFYDDKITKIAKDKPHLQSYWCIINDDGKVVKVFERFKTPYLFGCVYSVGENFYLIETDEHLCHAYSKLETKQFLFLGDYYNKDESKRGVLKVNKFDGTTELFKEK